MDSYNPGITGHEQSLAIFDFAGTLSLDTVLFSRDEMISRALKESGLADLGVADPGAFWTDVVGPTWGQGSTTGTGYVNILSSQIKDKFSDPEKPLSYPETKEAVSKFTRLYFTHSRVDPKWQSTFDYLSDSNNARVAIATDHYAEATDHIKKELEKMGHAANQKISIANSADLGYHKSTPDFWYALQKTLGSISFNNILLVDDFGHNEQEQDLYGGKDKALARRDKTTAILKEVFQTNLYSFPFFLENPDSDAESVKQDFHRLIEQAHAFIEKHI